LKGFAIGAGMLIPGVSGGTMAIIFGIYDDLIQAVSRFRTAVGRNLFTLVNIGAGGLLGVVLMSTPMKWLFERWPVPILCFVVGAVVAGVLPLFRLCRYLPGRPVEFVFDGQPIEGLTQTKERADIRPVSILGLVIGTGVGMGFELIPEDLIPGPEAAGFGAAAILLVVGFFFAIPLVLPGISASYVLVIFGIYAAILAAITDGNVLYLGPFVIGTFIGVVATAKVMDRLMSRHPQATYMTIIGFMIGSLFVLVREAMELWPSDAGMVNWILIPGMALTGFAAVYCMVSLGGKKE